MLGKVSSTGAEAVVITQSLVWGWFIEVNYIQITSVRRSKWRHCYFSVVSSSTLSLHK